MNLEHVKSSIIGDAMNKGISGGEMKRLSIAVEIVHFPMKTRFSHFWG
jgi:ABC-type multidrug transport system ATPase subunit